MDESDIKSLLKLGYWPVIAPTRDGIWRVSIYKKKKKKGAWMIHKQRLFNDPCKSSEWAIEYLADIYYTKEEK